MTLTAQAAGEGAAYFKELPNGLRVGTLPNGMQIILVPAPIEMAIARVRVARGFADERVSNDPKLNESGSAHTLEHLLFMGTTSFPELDKLLDQEGIKTNANTDWDETNYYEIGKKEKLETMVRTQSSMLREALLRDKDISDETRPVTEELAMRSQNPFVELIWLSLAAHAKNRGAHLMAGGIDEVKNVSPDTIRELYKRLYSADNMTAVIIGGMDDVEAVQDLVVREYGQIPRREGNAPARSMQAEFMPAKGEAPRLIKIKTDIAGRRMLNVQFPLEAVGKTEHAAILLKRYLNRKGEWSPLKSLYADGMINSAMADVDTYRDQTFLRVMFELTPKGELGVQQIAAQLSTLFGTIARKGLPEVVLNELKMNYALTHIEGRGLMDVAEELSKAAEKYGLDNLDAHAKNVLGVTPEELKEVAAKLSPERFQLTLVTPSAKGAVNPQLGRVVETVDLAPVLPALRKAFGETKPLAAQLNPFLHQNEPKKILQKGVAIIVSPDRETAKIDAVIEFNYSKSMTGRERVGADLAALAFRLDPKNAQLFDQIAEAAIDIEFHFNAADMTLAITAGGESNGASSALTQVLSRLRGYAPDEASLSAARSQMTKSLLESTTAEVSQQALRIGFHRVTSKIVSGTFPNRVDIQLRLDQLNAVKFEEAKAAFLKSQTSWGVKAVLAGNWSDAALVQMVPILLPQTPEDLTPFKHEAALPEASGPELVGRVVDHDRQGIARLYPVEVAQYSREFWAFQIFSEMLNKHLMDTVRSEYGLVYAVQSGFAIMPESGSVFYIVGDSSHKAAKVAMAYSVAMDDALYNGVFTEKSFENALEETAKSLQGQLDGAKGMFAQLFEGFDVQQISANLKGLTLAEVLSIVRPRIEGSKKVDAVAVGRADPVCELLLSRREALSVLKK